MRIEELISEINAGVPVGPNTCDTIKTGDSSREFSKVAVTMFATVDVIREAAAWGADFMIVHEPTFYNHHDVRDDDPVTRMKEELIRSYGLTIYRFHDHPHSFETDMIDEGELYYLGLKGTLSYPFEGSRAVLTLDEPVTALELGKRMEKLLGIQKVRISGAADEPCRTIALCFGARGSTAYEMLRLDGVDMALAGESPEWTLQEYARDAVALGLRKAAIVMGHIGSERDGMKLLAEKIRAAHPEFDTRYFDCGESCIYTDH